MTGRKDPGDGSATDRPRRLGRYRLSRLFLNVYFLAMGSFVAIAFVADFLVSTALKGISDDYTRRFMRGTIVLIEDELFRHPRAAWPRVIKQIDDKFSYRLDIVDRGAVDLAPAQLARLDAGEYAIDSTNDVIYHRLRNSKEILVVGPLNPQRTPQYDRLLPLDTRMSLLTWGVTGVLFAIVLWLWIRPVWRDLESLRQTARALGEGRLATRAGADSRLFAPLADTLNAMAERIQHLIATQKELSSAVSHELRTPIARLRFALEMLAETERDDERERLWKSMDDDLDELDALIDTSLTYARFERETPALNPVETALTPWIEDIVEDMRRLGGPARIDVDLSGLPENSRADLDRKWMPYALKNLLRNAGKYARSRIVVAAGRDGDDICINVDDDGIGVPEAEREHIFSAFTRLDRSRDRATGGYGLGLAITRRILELHRGRASAADSPLGGARFTLRWPARW